MDTAIIGVGLGDNGISTYCEGHWAMQGVGDLLWAIQEAGNTACSQCRTKEVDGEKK